MASILRYVYDVGTRELAIYHGEPGHVNLVVLPLSGLPAALKLAQIHGVRDVALAFSDPAYEADARQRAAIAAKLLDLEIRVIDRTWGDLGQEDA